MHAVPLSQTVNRSFMMRLLVLAVSVPLLAGISARAQTDTGAIVGTVRDSSGIVPGAQVEVTNVATNVSRKLVTNSAGQYQALQLIPGSYLVRVSRSGYETQIRQNITVNVQSRIEADFNLKVGAIQQVVRVSSMAASLQTQSAGVATVLPTQTVNQLPLNGRNYDQLALLAPGTYHMPSAEVANPAEGRFSANGNLELQNYFQLDGIDNNTGSENLQEQSTQAVIPPPDALGEFSVQTRTYSAEFGTSAGAVINASTKSGTNRFHGDVWDYIQNGIFDANTWFNKYGGVPRGVFNQNQFGGTLGGPIIRNHTFFFAAYQQLLSNQQETVYATVPTAAMKTGDFSSVLATHPMTAVANGQSGCIRGNIISSSCIDPVGKAIFNLYPNPSPQLVANPAVFTGAPNYQFVSDVPNNTRQLDVRIDHTLNPKNQLFGRYAFDVSDYQTPMWTGNPIAGNGNFSTQYILHDQSLALGWTYTPSSNTVNTAHFGFLRDFAHSDPVDLQLGVSDAPKFGLNGVPVTPETAGIPPNYIFGLQTIGSSIYRPQFQVAQVYQFVDDYYRLIGKHSLQFGYEYHENSLNFFDIEAPQGTWFSEGIYTNTLGFGAGDYLLGDMGLAIYETALEVNNFMRGNSFYGQDTWRFLPNLTVNYGVRYELYPPFWLNRTNQTANFTPANGGGFVTATSGGWYKRTLIHPDYANWAPRVGFAYHVARPVVLRGGFGIFHQFVNRVGSESMLQLNPPFLLDDELSQSLGSTTPVFQLKNGFPAATLKAQGISLPSLHIRAQDPNERTPYVEQVSFGPEIQLTGNTLLSLYYVGNWGRKENRLRNANQGIVTGYSGASPIVTFPYSNLNSQTTAVDGLGTHAFLELATNDGNSDYNALEVNLNRHFTRGLMYQISYTWSHNMADFVDNLTGGAFPQNAYDYAHEMSNSAEDVRSRFTGAYTWVLPIGKGGWVMNNNSKLANVIGGWQFNGIINLQTGIPFNVSAPDVSDTGSNHNEYPNCVGDPYKGATSDPHQYAGSNAPGFFINPVAFSIPSAGKFGSCRPRMFHGPGIQDENLSLFKSFSVGGERSLEFRGEFFNAFNHPNFANPSGDIAFPAAFGKSTNTTTNPRIIQFTGKFFF